jgi:hypothetical protein
VRIGYFLALISYPPIRVLRNQEVVLGGDLVIYSGGLPAKISRPTDKRITLFIRREHLKAAS